MRVSFYGVRGSFPVAHPKVARTGGNTSCVAVQAPGAPAIVIDAGTGLRRCSRDLMRQGFGDGGAEGIFLVSHTHWDHIQGFMYFEPFFRENRFTVVSRGSHDARLHQVFAGQAEHPYFSYGLDAFKAELGWRSIHEGDAFELGPWRIRTVRLNHPGVAIGYRIEHGGRSFVYMTDTAPYHHQLLGEGWNERKQEEDPDAVARLREYARAVDDFVAGADVLLYDTFFTPEQYAQNPHWGHSTAEEGILLARKNGVGRFYSFHHHPEAWDDELEARLADQRRRLGDGELEIEMAREGESVEL